jgi:hypothetical protein
MCLLRGFYFPQILTTVRISLEIPLLCVRGSRKKLTPLLKELLDFGSPRAMFTHP